MTHLKGGLIDTMVIGARVCSEGKNHPTGSGKLIYRFQCFQYLVPSCDIKLKSSICNPDLKKVLVDLFN
jgi:hypothetical protein